MLGRCEPQLLTYSRVNNQNGRQAEYGKQSDRLFCHALSLGCVGGFARQPRNRLDSPPDRLKLQMRVVLVHVLTRMAG